MNKLVKRGLSAYMIFLRNKLAMSVMMLIAGVMMTIGAVRGTGNDTKTLPSLIASVAGIFTFWAFYRIGYMRAKLEGLKKDELEAAKKPFLLQIGETAIYLALMLLGLFLLLNEGFTNQVLNLVTGGFTTLSGILGSINAVKNREKWQTFGWRFMLCLAVIELALGIYFLVAFASISNDALAVVGIITAIAGVIEVANTLKKEPIEKTIEDGKEILKTLREGE